MLIYSWPHRAQTILPWYPQHLHTCLIHVPHKVNTKKCKQRRTHGWSKGSSIHKNKQYFNQLLFLSVCKQKHTEKVNFLPCSCCKTTRRELPSMAKESKFLKSRAENPSPAQKVGWSVPASKTLWHWKGSCTYNDFQPIRPLYKGYSCQWLLWCHKAAEGLESTPDHQISTQC